MLFLKQRQAISDLSVEQRNNEVKLGGLASMQAP